MKRVVFALHNILRYVGLYGWVLDKRVLYIQIIIMLSWYFNNNKCLFAELEKKLFGETFQENNSVYVNRYHRNELRFLFVLGNLYWNWN